ncbi:hypothetical protein GCM10010326_68600 [Streptomyces xanthochromogenes]|uniref:Uncharacterized protein n=1 Tax=Streptomyces xanthochromogenes TaxID=67384 RepID=A0ABQ3AS85_9ACTN|nr:hypothetical protein GCM10010326_68600 [Streptomyces xanthochromogenes]
MKHRGAAAREALALAGLNLRRDGRLGAPADLGLLLDEHPDAPSGERQCRGIGRHLSDVIQLHLAPFPHLGFMHQNVGWTS